MAKCWWGEIDSETLENVLEKQINIINNVCKKLEFCPSYITFNSNYG